jgi:hypothetical protein
VGVGGRREKGDGQAATVHSMVDWGRDRGRAAALLPLLALVAAEARETWTGLRNQGSQLLSTGIGIGRRALHVIGCILH